MLPCADAVRIWEPKAVVIDVGVARSSGLEEPLKSYPNALACSYAVLIQTQNAHF